MNILHHKSWHVLRKENIARVRKDEAKAAADEQARLDRVKLADNEDRINRMRRNAAGDKDVDSYAQKPSSSNDQDATTTKPVEGHVNFFSELEEQERKNLASGGNKEYQKEKKKENDDWESKMGIMKRFAEDTKELSGETSWWETIERVKSPDIIEVPKVIKKVKSDKELRREIRKKLKKAKKRRRRYSSSSDDDDKVEAKRQKLEILRKERIERERAEHRRVLQLVGSDKKEASNSKETPNNRLNSDGRPKRPTYSNQFNPDFVRR